MCLSNIIQYFKYDLNDMDIMFPAKYRMLEDATNKKNEAM